MDVLHMDVYLDPHEGSNPDGTLNYAQRRLQESLSYIRGASAVIALYDEDENLIRVVIEGAPTQKLNEVYRELTEPDPEPGEELKSA